MVKRLENCVSHARRHQLYTWIRRRKNAAPKSRVFWASGLAREGCWPTRDELDSAQGADAGCRGPRPRPGGRPVRRQALNPILSVPSKNLWPRRARFWPEFGHQNRGQGDPSVVIPDARGEAVDPAPRAGAVVADRTGDSRPRRGVQGEREGERESVPRRGMDPGEHSMRESVPRRGMDPGE